MEYPVYAILRLGAAVALAAGVVMAYALAGGRRTSSHAWSHQGCGSI